MDKNGFSWLVLEPFVHAVVRDNNVLLYNTLGKNHLLYRQEAEITQIVRQLIIPENGYVAKLTTVELENPRVVRFIADLRKKFMGDLFDPQWSDSRPFNIVPLPILKGGILPVEQQLVEVTFQVNTSDLPDLKTYKEASRQFTFPVFADSPCQEMPVDMIRSVAAQMETLPFATVNFCGTGILDDPRFGGYRRIFGKTSFRRKYHVNLRHLIIPLTFIPGKNEHLALYFTFPPDQQQLDLLQLAVQSYAKHPGVEFNFIVQESREVDYASELISGLGIKHAGFKPYLNGENIRFFEDQVFMSESDIYGSKPGRNEVFSRISMNQNDYGKLTIFPNGDVYANVNDPLLGNLASHTVAELAGREHETGISWKRRRMDVEPCSHCLYQFLCPPVSSYEIMTRRFNFCHILR
ncbi:MAG: TIGR04150 pseudo-rSAM protein [Bacteroidota bacterium]